jgi:hypothetical protein
MTFTFINDGDLSCSRLVVSTLSRYQADCCDFVSVLKDLYISKDSVYFYQIF